MSHELQNCLYKLPDGPAYLIKSINNVWGGHERYIDQKNEFYALSELLRQGVFSEHFLHNPLFTSWTYKTAYD